MKREGRLHGMVRSCRILPSPWNPKPNSRFINRFDSLPTAGLFIKVDPRPTNHSKFSGKCGKPRCNGCHMHPTCKSKHKTKGTHKLKSQANVVHGDSGLELFFGVSASGVLDHLDNDELNCVCDGDVDDESENGSQ